MPIPPRARSAARALASLPLAPLVALAFAFHAALAGPAIVRAPDTPSFGSGTLTISPAHVAEGNAGLTPLVFHLSLVDGSLLPVHLTYRTEDGSALADSDYVPAAGALTLFGPTAEDSIVVFVKGDTLIEPNETLRLRVLTADGAALTDSVAVGTILNDDRTRFVIATQTRFAPYYDGSLAPAFADIDNDGDLDLPLYDCYTYDGYREHDGFRATLEGGNYHGSAWCDYDKDGDPDLVILPYEPEEGDTTRGKFYRNDHGALTDIAPSLGMDFFGNGETAVWGDFDGDDWPDLFTPYYSWRTPYRSFLYFNQHDGTFREDAVGAGVAMADQPAELDAEGAQAADWNEDGYLDLYTGGHLFQNDGTGHFTDVAPAVGLPALFDEGVEWVDYDNDGRLDLYLRGIDGPRLFHDDGASFHEVTAQAGLPPMPLGWGDRWLDADGDGDMDLLLASLDGPMQLYLNRGDGTFEPDAAFDSLHVKGVLTATGDVDGDGDVDFVTTYDTPTLVLNQLDEILGARKSYLRVRVLDRTGHETAFGATVHVRFPGEPGRGVLTRVVDGGSAYLTQSEYTLNFGGVGDGPVAVEVAYPSPLGSRIVVDGTLNPMLADLHPDQSPLRTIDVYEDGNVVFETGPVAGVADPGPTAGSARAWIAQAAPSPAWSATRFTVGAREAGQAALVLYDVAGRRVRALATQPVAAGGHATFAWNLADAAGRRAPAGVYFARLEWNGAPLDVRRIVVAR